MEFHVALAGAQPDPHRIEDLLLEQDPAALLDIDLRMELLRVSTWLPGDQLLDLLARAGCPVPPERMRQLPSICCGGCSG
jgi:hypothetical protein